MKRKTTKYPRPELSRLEIIRLLAAVPEPAKPDTLHCVARLAGLRLDGIDFTGMNLANVDFSYSSMRGCIFAHAEMRGCNFNQADFTGADFRSCDLSSIFTDEEPIYFNHANFTGANLNNVGLVGNQLEGANFTKADLRDTDLSHIAGLGAIFTDALLDGAEVISATLAADAFNDAKRSRIQIGTIDPKSGRVISRYVAVGRRGK